MRCEVRCAVCKIIIKPPVLLCTVPVQIYSNYYFKISSLRPTLTPHLFDSILIFTSAARHHDGYTLAYDTSCHPLSYNFNTFYFPFINVSLIGMHARGYCKRE